MAIYLKRESAIADTIQDPSKTGNDLDQIEKDIAGPNGIAAHEEEVEDAAEGMIDDTAKGLTPGCEIAESCYMALYESEYNFNQIIECIDIHTLRAASMDRELVLEAVDIKGFFTRLKDAIINAFKNFTKIISTIINKVTTILSDNKTFVQKNLKSIEGGFDELKKKTEPMKCIPYKHDMIEDYAAKLHQVADEGADKVNNVFALDKASVDSYKDASKNYGHYEDTDDRGKKAEGYIADLIKSQFGGADTAAKAAQVVVAACSGADANNPDKAPEQVSFDKVYANANELIKVLNSSTTKASISNDYKMVKSKIDEIIKKIDGLASNISDKSKADDAGYRAADYKFAAHVAREYQNLIEHVSSAICRLRADELVQARKVANGCINAYLSGKKYQESAISVAEGSVFANINLI